MKRIVVQCLQNCAVLEVVSTSRSSTCEDPWEGARCPVPNAQVHCWSEVYLSPTVLLRYSIESVMDITSYELQKGKEIYLIKSKGTSTGELISIGSAQKYWQDQKLSALVTGADFLQPSWSSSCLAPSACQKWERSNSHKQELLQHSGLRNSSDQKSQVLL